MVLHLKQQKKRDIKKKDGQRVVFWKQWQLKGVTTISDLYEDGIFFGHILRAKGILVNICRLGAVLQTNSM